MARPPAPHGRITDIENSVLSRLKIPAIRRDLADLVAFPSVGGSDAELDVQDWCAKRLDEAGLHVDHWSDDVRSLAAVDDFPGMEVARTEVWGCVATSMGEGTPALILNGHVDVVPPGDLEQWPDRNPYVLRDVDGTWAGRGACDMKGGVAAFFAAAQAIHDAGITLARPFAIHTVTGEEDGGLGSFATLRRGHTGQACIIAEPTDRQIVAANAGSLTFRIAVPGRSTHGSTRASGVSAIDKFELIHAALRKLEAERNRDKAAFFEDFALPWPLSVGTLRAGDWSSSVPDLCIAEGRYGVMPGESLATAAAAFEATIDAVAADDPWLGDHRPALSWPGGRFAPGRLDPGHPFLAETQAAVVDAGSPPAPAVGASYGSDLRLYAGAGIPTLQYGPGDIRDAHSVGERVEPQAVIECARAYALMILRRCR